MLLTLGCSRFETHNFSSPLSLQHESTSNSQSQLGLSNSLREVALVTSQYSDLFGLAGSGLDVTEDLQSCIDSIPENSWLELPAGLYRVHATIYVNPFLC